MHKLNLKVISSYALSSINPPLTSLKTTLLESDATLGYHSLHLYPL